MKYLWLGMYVPKGIMSDLEAIGYTPMSITIAQENLINGIREYTLIDTISGGRFPDILQGGRLRLKGRQWIDSDGSRHQLVDALNIRYVELLYKTLVMKRAVKAWLKPVSQEQLTVFVYGLHRPYLACARLIKKRCPNVRIVAIVPDLPEYYDFHMSKIKTMLKKIDVNNIRKNLRYIDKYILFTGQMANYLRIDKGDCMIMEGSIRTEDIPAETARAPAEDGQITIMYSGVIGTGYGIASLLDAFSSIDEPRYSLWLAGSGEAVPMVKEYAQRDKRIVYHGFISDRERLLEMQRQATMLVSLLPPNNPASRYCFPSKLFEYMASGNPTLSFYLPGIPQEYLEHLVEIQDNSPQGIAEAIRCVAAMPADERHAFGDRAREFIIANKTNTVQAKRMLDFIRTK